MHRARQFAITATLLVIASAALAQQPIVYPSKGQSAAQQSRDTAECQAWAKETTGVDPVAIAQQMANQPPPATGPQPGTYAKGAIGGAAIGGIVGGIGGRGGEGAAAGAVVGMASAHARQRERQQAQAQQQQAAQGQASSLLATFNRAYAACMTGRGYTVQ